jgi:hypothetical protein
VNTYSPVSFTILLPRVLFWIKIPERIVLLETVLVTLEGGNHHVVEMLRTDTDVRAYQFIVEHDGSELVFNVSFVTQNTVKGAFFITLILAHDQAH